MTVMVLSDVVQGVAEAKIQLPILRSVSVRRARLLERLAAVPDDVPLVLLTAPAGYGKTTLLSQWAAADRRRFGWVTLDISADGQEHERGDSDDHQAPTARHDWGTYPGDGRKPMAEMSEEEREAA